MPHTPPMLDAKIFYRLARDELIREGVLVNYSAKALEFLSRRPLKAGTFLRITVTLVHGEHASRHASMRVTSCRKEKVGYLIHTVFESDPEFPDDNRRAAPRHPVALKGRCRQQNAGVEQDCTVLDVSRTGARFELAVPFTVGKSVSLVIFQHRPDGSHNHITATVRIMSCSHTQDGVYQIGGQFMAIQHHIEPTAILTGAAEADE